MNRRPGDVITPSLVHLQAEQQMSETRHGNAVKAQESQISKNCQVSPPFPNTIISNRYIVRNPKEYQAHLLITGKNTQLPHIYFLCKIGSPHPFSFHVWVFMENCGIKYPIFVSHMKNNHGSVIFQSQLGKLNFHSDFSKLCFIRKTFQTQEGQNPFRKKPQEVTSPSANRK